MFGYTYRQNNWVYHEPFAYKSPAILLTIWHEVTSTKKDKQWITNCKGLLLIPGNVYRIKLFKDISEIWYHIIYWYSSTSGFPGPNISTNQFFYKVCIPLLKSYWVFAVCVVGAPSTFKPFKPIVSMPCTILFSACVQLITLVVYYNI